MIDRTLSMFDLAFILVLSVYVFLAGAYYSLGTIVEMLD